MTGIAVTPRAPWDPFALMDRLDDDVIRKELEGIASTELVYVVKDDKGKEVVGLSKVGIDECCNVLAHKGEVIREESCEWQFMGADEDREALFVVKAARFAVNPEGGDVRLDQVIGTKRQSLYYEAAQLLTLDTPCPGKKPVKDGKRRTFREMLEQEKGYLEWMADNFRDPATADFCKRILNGEDATVQPGRQFNPFWFEHGSMKAARNARSRLVSADVKAMVIARAKQAGQQKVVDQREQENGEQPTAQAVTPSDAEPTSNTPWPGTGAVNGKKLQEWTQAQLLWLLEPGRRGVHIEIWQGLAKDELKRRENTPPGTAR